MSTTIRRKAQSARKTSAAQGKKARVKQARRQTGSALEAVLAMLPFSEEQLHRIFVVAILGGAAVLVWLAASAAGVPTVAETQMAEIASQAGFEVRRVEVRGVKNINELKIYEKALAQRDRAMPLVDLEALRADLLALSWVKDARVSRQLPDTLVIDIVERTPHAVLRKADRYVLIDETGAELDPVSARNAKGKLIVSGPGAGQQVVALSGLLRVAPALQPQVAEAEWIGNRRWNLTFQTGQVLALPEGERESGAALLSFARLNGTNRLLGGKVAAFDMRAGDRIYFRVPGREEAEEEEKAAASRAKVAAATANAAVPVSASTTKESE
ncbi:cell division protein FtsQ/DivIB [Novosphingobium colocasiae]|uniref:cell division protein FtsQ/DivIB n=1 Tax=Novosphingobium colocasiae TaxID=1256513 RepID=UPI0035B1F71D